MGGEMSTIIEKGLQEYIWKRHMIIILRYMESHLIVISLPGNK